MKSISKYKRVYAFALLLILCWFFPYTGDDWAWGSAIGIERLQTFFAGYNGRYLGNLIVLALTRSNLAKSVAMALTLTGIAAEIEYITGAGWAFSFGLPLVFLAPKTLLRQAVVWTSGFSNYAVSTFLFLLFLCYLFRRKSERNDGVHLRGIVLLFFLGVSDALIVEHVAVCSVACAVIFGTLIKVREKRTDAGIVSFGAGALTGCAIMFSNAFLAGGYRTVAEGGIFSRAWRNYRQVIYYDGCWKNVVLNTVLLSSFLLLIVSCKERYSEKDRRRSRLILGYQIVFLMLNLVSTTNGMEYVLRGYETVEAVMTAFYFCSVVLFMELQIKYLENLRRARVFLLCIVLLTGPLFFVTPIGPRLFFTSYVLQILLIGSVLKEVPVWGRLADDAGRYAAVAFCAVWLFYLHVYSTAAMDDRARINRIRQEVERGEKGIEIQHIRYESFLWQPTPFEDFLVERYRLFYRLPESADLILAE